MAPPFTSCAADSAVVARLPHTGWYTSAPPGYTNDWYRGIVPATAQNKVVAYIYGQCAYADIADALASATDPSHRIYLAGWWMDPDCVLKAGNPNLLLRDCLSSTKAAVRGLFYDPWPRSNPNNQGYLFIHQRAAERRRDPRQEIALSQVCRHADGRPGRRSSSKNSHRERKPRSDRVHGRNGCEQHAGPGRLAGSAMA